MSRKFDIVSYLAVLCLALAVLTGCNKGLDTPVDDPSQDPAVSDTPISFASEDAWTRAGSADLAAIQSTGFQVWGLLTSDAHPSGVHQFGQSGTHVTYDASTPAWTYSPIRYWMRGTYNFAAVYPHDTPATYGVQNGSANPVLKVQDVDMADQEDLRVAFNTDLSSEGNHDPVMLDFKHALACVQVIMYLKAEDFYEVNVDDEGNVIYVNGSPSLKLDQNGNPIPIGSARVTRIGFNDIYKKGSLSAQGYEDMTFVNLPADKGQVDFTYTNAEDQKMVDYIGINCFDGEGLFVIPQSLADGSAQFFIEANVIYPTILNAPIEYKATIPLSITESWKPNTRYVYKGVISQSLPIEFTALSVNPWESESLGGFIVK